MIADTLWPVIEAQAAALGTILRGDTYRTDLGRIVSLDIPAQQDPAPQIYLSAIEPSSNERGDSVTLTATWAAIVVESPMFMWSEALTAQAEMVHALRNLCSTRVQRGDIDRRAPGSNSLVATVRAVVTIPEIQPDAS
jgi:hypothetical protein